MGKSPSVFRLTAQLNSDEVGRTQILQKNPRRRAGLEVEGDVEAQLRLEGGKMEVGRFLVEGRRVPH